MQNMQNMQRIIFMYNMQNMQTWTTVAFVLLHHRNKGALVLFHPGIGLGFNREQQKQFAEPDIIGSELKSAEKNTQSWRLVCCNYIFYIFDMFVILIFLIIFFKAYYSCVTTSLWILVLFHDSSRDRSFTSANPAQFFSENRC